MENKEIKKTEVDNCEISDEALDEVAGGLTQFSNLTVKADGKSSGKKKIEMPKEQTIEVSGLDGMNLLDKGQSFRL